MAKYKATGCTRFLFFLIIFVPIAYFGSQYLMNSGKWEEWQSKIDPNQNSVEQAIEKNRPDADQMSDREVQQKLKELLDRIESQDEKLKEQEETIHKQNILIDQLRQQLNTGGQSNQNPVPSNKKDGNSLEELLKEADKALKKN